MKQEELAEYLQSYRAEREAGETAVDACRVAMQGVLISRSFSHGAITRVALSLPWPTVQCSSIQTTLIGCYFKH